GHMMWMQRQDTFKHKFGIDQADGPDAQDSSSSSSSSSSYDMQDHTTSDHSKNCLDKAFAVIDIMNSSLLLVVQDNETDHINILK
ncbi:hypothetical protein ACJX0J_035486, partial [Zea mays]